MAMRSTQNTYPIALGVRIAGVDDATYSQTGEAYSTVALPATDMHTSRTLQEEDTSLAYEAQNDDLNPSRHTRRPVPVCSHPTRSPFAVRAQVSHDVPLEPPDHTLHTPLL